MRGSRSAVISVVLVLASTAGVAAAQCHHVPDATVGQGACSVVPFGTEPGSPFWTSQRYQTLVTAADLQGQAGAITAIGFVPCATSTAQYGFDSLTVTVGSLFGGRLSKTFDQNLGPSSVQVLAVTDFTWPVRAGVWNELHFARPFPFDPANGDVVIDITIKGGGLVGSQDFGMRAHTGRQRVFAAGYTGAPPAMAQFDDMRALRMRVCMGGARFEVGGTGCPAVTPLTLSYGGSAAFGSTLVIAVSNGEDGMPGVLVFGASIPPPYPINLGPIGMVGCQLWVPAAVTLGLSFSGGTARLQVPIPAASATLPGAVYNQAFAVRSGAPVGLATSNWGRVVPGQ